MIDYLVQLYFSQIYSGIKNKMFSKSITLAITIAEMEDCKDELSRLRFIYENTTAQLGIALPILEDIYEKSYRRDPKMKTYSLFGKEVALHEIIKALSDAYSHVTTIVTKIAKEMNVDLEFDLSKYGDVVKGSE